MIRPLRIVLVALRDGGEAAHVGEHDRQLALLAAEHDFLRRLRELLDQHRRHVLREDAADLHALPLLAHEAREDEGQVDRGGRQQRIGEVDEVAVLPVEEPGRADQDRGKHRAREHQPDRAEIRREDDDENADDQRGEQLDAERVVRLRDDRAAQHAFDHLGVDLDARHGRGHRRGLDVVQPGRGGADQHQLAGDLARRHGVVEHVGCRDIDRGIAAGVMHPELAVLVGRDLDALEADGADAGLVGANQQRRRSRDDPQDLEAERGHDVALGAHDHRHAADKAVALGLDGEQATAGSDLLDDGHVAQQAGEFEQEFFGVLLADRRDAGEGKRLVELGLDHRQPGFAEDHVRALDRFREDLVVARQLAQPGAGGIVQIAHLAGDQIRIEPVRFGKHHVEADRHRTVVGEVDDHVRDPRARPRPLAELGEAPVVDVDDGDRPHRLVTGIDQLEQVEGAQPQFLDRRRIPDAQARKDDQQPKAHQPRKAELSRKPPAQDFETFHVSRASCRASRPRGRSWSLGARLAIPRWQRIMDFLPRSGCAFIAGKAAARRSRRSSDDVEDEIAGLERGGHVLQQQRLMLRDRALDRAICCCQVTTVSPDCWVMVRLLMELTSENWRRSILSPLDEIGDGVRGVAPARIRREHELILAATAGQRVRSSVAKMTSLPLVPFSVTPWLVSPASLKMK